MCTIAYRQAETAVSYPDPQITEPSNFWFFYLCYNIANDLSALHFKLAVATDTSATVSYEETEFTYTPRLDSNRDRDLLDILPDYLTEEITFSRQNAAKFYSRVVETLTKQVRE